MKEFTKQFFKKPKQVGSIFPSSGKLINKMISYIDFSKDIIIIDAGCGNGNFSKVILEKMTSNSLLYSFELDEELYEFCKQNIFDDRIKFMNDSVENIDKYFYNNSIDYIVSGLPFGSLPLTTTENILSVIYNSLVYKGIYLQFQYFLQNKKQIEKSFSDIEIDFEICNIPPAFFYICEKK